MSSPVQVPRITAIVAAFGMVSDKWLNSLPCLLTGTFPFIVSDHESRDKIVSLTAGKVPHISGDGHGRIDDAFNNVVVETFRETDFYVLLTNDLFPANDGIARLHRELMNYDEFGLVMSDWTECGLQNCTSHKTSPFFMVRRQVAMSVKHEHEPYPITVAKAGGIVGTIAGSLASL